MPTWLATPSAYKALSVGRSTLLAWRKAMPKTLSQLDEDTGKRLWDVEGIAAWRKTQRGRGRPRDVPKLTSGPHPSDVAKASLSPASPTCPPSTPDGSRSSDASALEELDPDLKTALLELLAGGGDPAQILELSRRLPAETINRLSALGKTRKDLADAEKRELENQRARGDVVALADVESFWGGQISIVHSSFMAMPGRLAGKLHALETAEEIYEVLEAELRRVLEQFSRELVV